MEKKAYTLGVDLGGTNIAVGVVDKSGKILDKYSVPTGPMRDYKEIVADMAFACEKAVQTAGLSMDSIKGIGIGSPGTVDPEAGIVIYTNNIKFENTPIKEELQKHINLPVYMGNDANCAALGETSDEGAAKGFKNVVMITLGTGLGGGVIINGKIYPGEYGAGAELGHMVIVAGGALCTCGRRGCWEAYSSSTGLIRMTKEALEQDKGSVIWELIENDMKKVSARTAFDAARKGDTLGLEIVREYISYLSEGVINIINIFRPEIFLVGGGISNEGDYLLNPLKDLVSKNIYGGLRIPVPVIMKAKLGNDAGIIGASMLVDQ